MASGSSSGTTWTWEEDKLFECALATYDLDAPDVWEHIAKEVGGGKTAEDIKKHYDDLVTDVMNIEAGRVPLPDYAPMPTGLPDYAPMPTGSESDIDKGKDKSTEEDKGKGKEVIKD